MNVSDNATEIIIVMVARLCLSFFFLPSAIKKLTNQHPFIQGILDYQVLPARTALVLGFVLPWIELAVGLGLVLGGAVAYVGTAAGLLLLCFTMAIIINLHRGRQIACYCYSLAGTTTISWGTVVRNLLLLLLSVVVVAFAPPVARFDLWFEFWQNNLRVITSVNITLLLMLCMCLILLIYLVEWAVSIHVRISRLRSVQR
jgi:uncharacterized membrane protein YphA (DoxX/SURF4 family)